MSKLKYGFIVPTILCMLSLILFWIIYNIVGVVLISVDRQVTFLFFIPPLVFGGIAMIAAYNRMSVREILPISIALAIIFSVSSIALGTFLWLQTSDSFIIKENQYAQALELVGYPSKATAHFPDKIPANAENVQLRLQSAIGQGGTELSLQYTYGSPSDIQLLEDRLAVCTIWSGKPNAADAGAYGLFHGFTNYYPSEDIPTDLTVYIIYSHPYQKNNWNHGVLGYVAISKKIQNIIYYYSKW